MPDGLQINTDKVGDVAKGLKADVDTRFADSANRGTQLHSHGVEFGRRLTPSAAMGDAKARYAQALENTEANLRAYKLAAGALATGAEQIAKLFAETDMSSAEAQLKIRTMMTEAISAANAIMEGSTEGSVL